jgi:hypothetical protein
MAGQEGGGAHAFSRARAPPPPRCTQREPSLPKPTEQWKREEISLARLAADAGEVLNAMCKARAENAVDAVDMPQKKGWGGAGGGAQPGGSACRLFWFGSMALRGMQGQQQ